MAVIGAFEAFERKRGLGWTAKGWAFDPETPHEPVRLVLTAETGPLGEIRADLFQPELAAAGYGHGFHAFSVKLPEQLLDDQPHYLQFIVLKEQRPLPGKVSGLFFPPRLRGQVDYVKSGAVYGWALDDRDLDRPVTLEIDLDGHQFTNLSSNEPRADLAKMLGTKGRYGFYFPYPAEIFDGRPHKIGIRFANTRLYLEGGQIDLTLPAVLLTKSRQWLDQEIARRAAALLDDESALALEPVKRLDEATAYRDWLVGHEAAIAKAAKQAAGTALPAVSLNVFALTTDMTATAMAQTVAADSTGAVVFLEPGGALHPAFTRLVGGRLAEGDADIVYTDEDTRSPDGSRRHPHFKPSFDPERYRAFPYVGTACAIGHKALATAIRTLAAADPTPDLNPSTNSGWRWVQAVIDTALLQTPPERVARLPLVLYHRPTPPESRAESRAEPPTQRLIRVQASLAALSSQAQAQPQAQLQADGCIRVRWPLPNPPPKATLIIPTRDRLDLLRVCLDSVRTSTDYPDFEIVIIDNGSEKPQTLDYLAALTRYPETWPEAWPKLRVMPWPGAFNFSAMHNALIDQLTTDYAVLLNNDVEVIDADWLSEMMSLAVRPEVGAVGAKLLYPNGMIQHGGVLIGMNHYADHAQRIFSDDDEGYFHSAQIVQSVSAVTAACMVVRCADYRQVGGMDADNLAVSFNDVDLCLKLRQLGRNIIWTPHARLYHHESATRRSNVSEQARERGQRELTYLRAKWRTDSYQDPFYSPNLARSRQTHVDFSDHADRSGQTP